MSKTFTPLTDMDLVQMLLSEDYGVRIVADNPSNDRLVEDIKGALVTIINEYTELKDI